MRALNLGPALVSLFSCWAADMIFILYLIIFYFSGEGQKGTESGGEGRLRETKSSRWRETITRIY